MQFIVTFFYIISFNLYIKFKRLLLRIVLLSKIKKKEQKKENDSAKNLNL